jgi:hypothetical protein
MLCMDSVADIVFFHARTPTLLPFASESVMRAFLEYPEARRQQYARDYVVSIWSGWHAAIRLSVHGLLSGASEAWLEQHFDRDVLRDIGREDRRLLNSMGLLSLTTPEWCAERFEGRELAMALIQGGLSGKEPGWYEDVLKDADMTRVVLRKFGLNTAPIETTREALLKKHNFCGPDLIEDLEDVGLLNDREWIARHFKNYWSMVALERGGLLTSDVGREWYVSHFGAELRTEALDKAGLLTSECGRDWYASHLYGEDLLYALKKSGLLTAECGLDWYSTHFHGHYKRLEAAKMSGVLPLCSHDELAAAFDGEKLYLSLKHGGKLTETERQTREWYAEKLPSKYLLRALRRTGLLTAEAGRDWYSAHLKGHHLFEALEACGLLTADPGREWYKRAFTYDTRVNSKLVHKSLLKAGLLTADAGRDWYVALATGKVSNAMHPVLAMLRHAGLVTRDAGIEWYERHFGGRALYEVLEETGLMPHDESLEWYAARFDKRALHEVLTRIERVAPTEFVREHIGSYFRMQKYADMALYRAGLLQEETTHRWFASHLEGEELFEALKTHGLLTRELESPEWYGYTFKGELLLRCLKETGHVPFMSGKDMYHFLEDEQWEEAYRIKRDYWRHRQYPNNRRSSGPTYFGYDCDETWCVMDTYSGNSGCTRYSSFRQSSSGSYDLIRGIRKSRHDIERYKVEDSEDSWSTYSCFVSLPEYGVAYELC